MKRLMLIASIVTVGFAGTVVAAGNEPLIIIKNKSDHGIIKVTVKYKRNQSEDIHITAADEEPLGLNQIKEFGSSRMVQSLDDIQSMTITYCQKPNADCTFAQIEGTMHPTYNIKFDFSKTKGVPTKLYVKFLFNANGQPVVMPQEGKPKRKEGEILPKKRTEDGKYLMNGNIKIDQIQQENRIK